MRSLLWTLAFLATSYLEGSLTFPRWMPDLSVGFLLLGSVEMRGFVWVALLGGLLRGGLFGWMEVPLLFTGFVLLERPLRHRLNFESRVVRGMWFAGWAAVLGVFVHTGVERAFLGGLLALILYEIQQRSVP